MIDRSVMPPDPGDVRTTEELGARLRTLRSWAGDPSFRAITGRVNAARLRAGRPTDERATKTTVMRLFEPGRRRYDTDLVLDVVAALCPDDRYVDWWRQALLRIGRDVPAAAQVRASDRLPDEDGVFAGRDAELGYIRRLRLGSVPVVVAISGMGGIGKTRLVVHAARKLLADRHFDRVLFVDLRGYRDDKGQGLASPAAALDSLLRLLGVPGDQVPADPTDRAARFARMLAGQTALVILDNAYDEAQVRPLLPATSGSLTLVTSRARLTGLSGAVHVALDILGADEAIAYLEGSVHADQMDGDREALGKLAELCGYLPLALTVTAATIRARPDWTAADHVDRLKEQRLNGRLEAMVDLTLDLSYRRVPPNRQRLFRLATLHPGPDIDRYAAAAVAGIDPETAEHDLRSLHAEALLQTGGSGRYTYHDQVRTLATSRAQDDDSPTERRAALARLLDYYVATAAAAVDLVSPADRYLRPRVQPSSVAGSTPVDSDAARRWLEDERPSLVAIAITWRQHGLPAHAIALSRVLEPHLKQSDLNAALIVHTHALDAAGELDDRLAEGQAHLGLGGAFLRLGQGQRARDHFDQALIRLTDSPDRFGHARALQGLGVAGMWMGDYSNAYEHCREALQLSRMIDDPIGEADALYHLATIDERLGRTDTAGEHLQGALRRYQEAGAVDREARTLNGLGDIAWRCHRDEEAADHFTCALELFRAMGDRSSQAWMLTSLGTVITRLGRFEEATALHHEAAEIFRQSGNVQGEAWILNGLGEAAQAAHRVGDALHHYQAALEVAQHTGVPDQVGRAEVGLGQVYRSKGEPDTARQHLRQAERIFVELGGPEADEVRTVLAELDREAGP
jgi:tetratricopeptide (TPR) repeat protein